MCSVTGKLPCWLNACCAIKETGVQLPTAHAIARWAW